MNINNLSLNHIVCTSSSEEDIPLAEKTACEEMPQAVNKHIETNLATLETRESVTDLFQKTFDSSVRLTLSEAEDLMSSSINGRIVHFLSPLNLLLVDSMKIIKQLKKDSSINSSCGTTYNPIDKRHIPVEIKGYKVCQLLSLQINLLFRIFRKHSFLNEGKIASLSNKKNLNYARISYIEIDKLFEQLECLVKNLGSNETKKLCCQLKRYCDILYHLCHNESFLTKSSQSLSPSLEIKTSVLTYPPGQVHFELYLDSLDLCLSSLVDYRQIEIDEASTLIQKTLEKIKQLSKGSVDTSEEFTFSIQKLKSNLDQCSYTYIKALEKIIFQSKSDKANPSLLACFQCIESHSSPLLKTLQEMVPLVQQVCNPWDLFRQQCHQMLNECDKEYDLIQPQANQTFQMHEGLLKKNKTLSREVRNQIKNLKSSLRDLLSVETIKTKFNAQLVENVRLTMNIAQEINLFFVKINSLNLKANALHQSLVKSQKELPCSAFNALDLYIQQAVDLTALMKKQNSSHDQIDSIHLNIRQMVCALMKAEHFLAINPEEKDNQKNIVQFFERLHKSVQLVNDQFNNFSEGPFKDHPLKTSNHLLEDYLNNLGQFEILNQHIFAGLSEPIGQQNEVSLADVHLIRKQMRLINFFADLNIDEPLVNLEKAVREELNSTPDAGKFFWKLNLKNVILTRLLKNERQKKLNSCLHALESTQTVEQVLETLHKLYEGEGGLAKRCKGWNFQLAFLNEVALSTLNKQILASIEAISIWNLSTAFFLKAINEIVHLNTRPRKSFHISPPTHIEKSVEIPTDFESDDEKEFRENKSFLSFSKLSQAVFFPTLYESNLNLIYSIKKEKLPLLNANEELESFSFRSIGRDELLRNSCIYLSLIEEAQKCNLEQELPLPLQKRGEIYYLLLVEAAQKIALASLQIPAKKSPNLHILTSEIKGRPLLFTHNGVLLNEFLHKAGKQWFDHPVLNDQEHLLKRAYWFQEEQPTIENVALIKTCCETAWKELAASVKDFKSTDVENQLYTQTAKLQNCRSKIHKIKRSQPALSLPVISAQDLAGLITEINSLIALLQFDPQCCDLAKGAMVTINRTLDLSSILMNADGKHSAPLNFAMHLAEIQVSLLSSVLILALSSQKANLDQPHPLFSDQGGRSLFQSHQVNRLWKVLKNYQPAEMATDCVALLDRSLPFFVGDPRYPYPNKTVMTNELIEMHKKVHLLQKIKEGGWFNKEDQPLLAKHLGTCGKQKSEEFQKEILNQSIMQAIEAQQQKTGLALELSALILRECIPK
ncbi:MAG: hypothetical protein H0V82_07540 [Candidatus Protochlamydia sp.]|nr:hypothetical protein [Candidatus Protochlamydia sp.]